MSQSPSKSRPAELVAGQLRSIHKQLVFHSEPLNANQVRMHFAGYDKEAHAFRPFAGLKTARRFWSKTPEPTVIFGFESDEFLRISEDAMILEHKAVAWLAYTSSHKEIEEAIKTILSAPITYNDRRIQQLTEIDFDRALQDFGHIFKPNIINSLTIRKNDLLTADAEIRRTQYLAFSNGAPDYLGEQKKQFEKILSRFTGGTILEGHQAEMSKVGQWLDDADCIWRATIEKAQFPFSTETVLVVVDKISLILVALEQVYAMIGKIRSQLTQQAS